MGAERAFPFRPWVRETCRKAMLWGIGVVAVLGWIAWFFRAPGSAPLSRAFGALVLYGLFFLASLLKVWWTARLPAVVVTDREFSYRLLHLFRPRVVRFASVLEGGPRPGTGSLRFLVEREGAPARELFLNLGAVGGQSELVDLLGERLVAHGLEPVAGSHRAWRRPEERMSGSILTKSMT